MPPSRPPSPRPSRPLNAPRSRPLGANRQKPPAAGTARGAADLAAIVAGPSLDAARALLGSRLVRDDGRGLRVGRLVELEAYVGREDQASHARMGPTPRNAVMFGPPGRAYVYLTYGMHHCLNIVTESEGRPAALLVRAVEPLEGVELMREARVAAATRRLVPDAGASVVATLGAAVRERHRIEALAAERLAAGPGLVCAAFDIDRRLNGVDLLDPASPLRLEPGDAVAPETIAAGPRIGMGSTPEPWFGMPWRFTLPSPSLSRPAPRREEGR